MKKGVEKSTQGAVMNTGKATKQILRILTGLAMLAFVLVGCGGGVGQSDGGKTPVPAGTVSQVGTRVEAAGGAYTNLKPGELKLMLDNKDFFLVDTHVPPEGRLPKTDARIPFDQVEQQIGKLPADKTARIVLACRTGRMSSAASATLVRLGYTNVYNLDGGMVAWAAEGYEIVPEGK